jgi:MFS family permease
VVGHNDQPGLRKLRVVSVLVCGIVGPILGCAVTGLVTGNPLLVVMSDIAGAPLVAYALISMALPGAAAGVLASGLAGVLIRRGHATGAHRRFAPLVGTALGGIAGFILGGVDPRLGDARARLCLVTTITGAICGLLIAAYALWLTRASTMSADGEHVPA